jgi:hypothetical protein
MLCHISSKYSHSTLFQFVLPSSLAFGCTNPLCYLLSQCPLILYLHTNLTHWISVKCQIHQATQLGTRAPWISSLFNMEQSFGHPIYYMRV